MTPQEEFLHALKVENAYFFTPDGRFDPPTEFDQPLNDVQRMKIVAFAKMHGGKCVVGRVNLYREDPIDKPIMKEWKLGDKHILNFEWSFIIPERSPELEQLIFERDQTPYEGTRQDWDLVEAIHKLLDDLGGHQLHWV